MADVFESPEHIGHLHSQLTLVNPLISAVVSVQSATLE
jgi:hypothetical protein